MTPLGSEQTTSSLVVMIVLFQKITPVIHVPEGISPPGELADLQRDEDAVAIAICAAS